jgi:hypothetical protein
MKHRYVLEVEVEGAVPPNSRNLATMVRLALEAAIADSGHCRSKWDIADVVAEADEYEPTLAELTKGVAVA